MRHNEVTCTNTKRKQVFKIICFDHNDPGESHVADSHVASQESLKGYSTDLALHS